MSLDEAAPVAITGATTESAAAKRTDATIVAGLADRIVSSQQVSWWDVHEYVAPTLAVVESWPMVGTPAWYALDNQDPAKIAAVFEAARHWALRIETCQQARCEAGRDISAAADWSAISRENPTIRLAHCYKCCHRCNQRRQSTVVCQRKGIPT